MNLGEKLQIVKQRQVWHRALFNKNKLASLLDEKTTQSYKTDGIGKFGSAKNIQIVANKTAREINMKNFMSGKISNTLKHTNRCTDY